MGTTVRSLVVALIVGGVLVAGVPVAQAVTLPPGFSDELVTSVGAPTALAFTPDGRTLITTQPGRLVVFNGSTQTTVLDLTTRDCSDSERGLLGVAVDPGFTLNRFIYVFWTARTGSVCNGTAVNRVSRFEAGHGPDRSADRNGPGRQHAVARRQPQRRRRAVRA